MNIILSQMLQIIAPLSYFSNVDFFYQFLNNDLFLIEAHENYQKQTFRNRCQILTSQGVQDLTVPILKSESKFYKDIKIDFDQRWQEIHCRSIKTAYGKAPYFEHYFDVFEKLIMTKNHFLFDLNHEILTKCLQLLKVEKQLVLTSDYKNCELNSNFIDLRNKKLLIDNHVEYIKNNKKTYYQTFGKEFVNNLSIIDLIFNEGTNAKQFLYI